MITKRFRRDESGFSLLMVLILLVVISLLGIAIMRSSAMQERMSGNLRDRSLAMQGAEAALQFARTQVLAGRPEWATLSLDRPPTSANCTDFGVCDASRKGTPATVVWNAVPAGQFDARLAAAPEYRIEFIGIADPGTGVDCNSPKQRLTVDCQSPHFRITARSRAVGRAEVVLNAIVASHM